jgi:uncharacterized membrane protein
VRRLVSLITLAFALLIWNVALLAAPAGTMRTTSGLTYMAGALICHQQPERSFHRDGAQYPVCARCHGLYAGAMLGVLAWVGLAGVQRAPRARAQRWLSPHSLRALLALVALPTLVTVALAWTGVWDAPNLLRALLAVPLGLAIAVVVAAVAAGDLR